MSPAQWDNIEVRELVPTGVDGSGAIGVLAHCRNKRKNILGSLVLKLALVSAMPGAGWSEAERY